MLKWLFGEPENRFQSVKSASSIDDLNVVGHHKILKNVYLKIPSVWGVMTNARSYGGASLHLGGGIRIHNGTSQAGELTFREVSHGELWFCERGLAFVGTSKSGKWRYRDLLFRNTFGPDGILMALEVGDSLAFKVSPDLSPDEAEVLLNTFGILQDSHLAS